MHETPLPKAVALLERACVRLGLELEVLDPEYNFLVEVRGPGFRRVLLGGISPLNDKVASRIAADKHYTSLILERAGFQVPESIRCLSPVHFQMPAYRARAGIEPGLAFARAHGFPVMVKPNRASKGRGVTSVNDPEELVSAIEHVFSFDSIALVQPIFPVPDVRLDFLDREYLLGYERIPITVTGDGTRSVRALASAEDARFEDAWRWPQAGLDPDRVPAAGELIGLSGAVLNLNRFAKARFIETIPAPWLEHCVRIGEVLGLRHYGIDFRGASLDDPPERATVIEVNSSPLLLRIHDLGWAEQAIDAQTRVLEAMMRTPAPGAAPSRADAGVP